MLPLLRPLKDFYMDTHAKVQADLKGASQA